MVCLSECWGAVGSQAMGTGPWALGTGPGARGTGHGARGTGHGARGSICSYKSQRGSDSRSSRDLYTCKDWCEREPEGHNYNRMVQKPSN